MVFDAESKSVLHIEMAKKNLFVKRGESSFNTLFHARVKKALHSYQETYRPKLF